MSMYPFQAVNDRLTSFLPKKTSASCQAGFSSKAKVKEHKAGLKEYEDDEAHESLTQFFKNFDPSQREKELKEHVLHSGTKMNQACLQGSYDECIDCGQDIEYKPFMIYSHAKRCLNCQVIHQRIYSGRQEGE